VKKVLVIGGSGFLGRHMMREIIRQGFEVHVLQHRDPIRNEEQVNIIKGSISSINRKMIREIKPDIVFHLARPKFPRLHRTGRHLAARYAAWLNEKLIRELGRSGYHGRLIFASGSLMYGNSDVPVNEDFPLNPISYARQYYRGEMPIINSFRKGTIPITVIRYPWLLGRGSWFEWFYLKTMEKNGSIPLFGEGNNNMEIIDILDAARATVQIAASGEMPEIYNLRSPCPVTQSEFAQAVSKVSGMPVRDYRQVISGRIEWEALEAFTSNIVFTSKYNGFQMNFQYNPLTVTISRILDEYARLNPV
jgi:UDP-glucose 4-epimerase